MPRLLPTLTITLGLVAASSLSYAWYLHGQLAKAEADLAARSKPLPSSGPAFDHHGPPVMEQGLSGGLPAPLVVPGGSPATNGPVPGRAEARAESGPAWNSPEFRRLMAMQRRAALDGRYAALFRTLKLSPADLEKFKDLLVDRQSAAADVFNTAREQGLNPRENRDQIRQLIEGFEAEADASIRSMLGETAYQQYQQYEKTAPQRSVVGQIEQRLSYSSTPLYGNQAEQLVNLLAASAPARPITVATSAAGPVAQGGGPGDRGTIITDAIIAQSKAFLSSSQVDALRQLQQEQNSQGELRQQMQQTRRNAPNSSPSGTRP
jgi:hypothetical protein